VKDGVLQRKMVRVTVVREREVVTKLCVTKRHACHAAQRLQRKTKVDITQSPGATPAAQNEGK